MVCIIDESDMRVGCFDGGASPPPLRLVRRGPRIPQPFHDKTHLRQRRNHGKTSRSIMSRKSRLVRSLRATNRCKGRRFSGRSGRRLRLTWLNCLLYVDAAKQCPFLLHYTFRNNRNHAKVLTGRR